MSDKIGSDEAISLVQHGWDGCSIPANLKNLLDNLPTWKHLRILRPPEYHGGVQLYFPWDACYDASGTCYMPAIEMGKLLGEGAYGKVYKARRSQFRPVNEKKFERFVPFHDIVSKQNEIDISDEEKKAARPAQELAYQAEIQAILYEATIHALVYHTLGKEGMYFAVPALYEVYAFSTKRKPLFASEISKVAMNMEYIQGKTLFDYLKTHMLPTSPTMENDDFLIDVLIQLCIYLDILQKRLRFNHRDLKVNNVLLREHTVASSPEISHKVLPKPWVRGADVVIIDFGFSCIACGEDNTSLVQAGCWFKPSHECMKPGRDIALFLYSLQTYFPLENRISPELFHILEKAMHAKIRAPMAPEKTVPLFDGVDDKGRGPKKPLEFGTGIYKMLRSADTDVPGCAPQHLMRRLYSLHASRMSITEAMTATRPLSGASGSRSSRGSSQQSRRSSRGSSRGGDPLLVGAPNIMLPPPPPM